MVAATGVVGARLARPHRAWFAVLVVLTVIGVAGPLVALGIFRDQPDIFVPVAAAIELLAAIVASGYSLAASWASAGKIKGPGEAPTPQ